MEELLRARSGAIVFVWKALDRRRSLKQSDINISSVFPRGGVLLYPALSYASYTFVRVPLLPSVWEHMCVSLPRYRLLHSMDNWYGYIYSSLSVVTLSSNLKNVLCAILFSLVIIIKNSHFPNVNSLSIWHSAALSKFVVHLVCHLDSEVNPRLLNVMGWRGGGSCPPPPGKASKSAVRCPLPSL